MKSNNMIICILFFMLSQIQDYKAVEFNFDPSDNSTTEQDSSSEGIKFKDASGNILLQILDEGEGSSLILPPLSDISNPEGKIYNLNNTLYWNTSPIGQMQTENGWSLIDNNVILSDSGSLIGIGIDNPIYKIHLENGSIFTKGKGNLFYGLIIENQEGRGVIRLRGTTSDENYNGTEIMMEDLNNGSSWRLLNTHSNDFSIVNHSAETGFKVPFKLEFGAPSNSLIISSNGNIGIGAISGEHKLAVGGSIISEEVVVRLRSNWPDYVFSEDYELWDR